MKRVLVASLYHESNTFNPIVTKEDDFICLEGNALFDRKDMEDSLSGVMQTLQHEGYEAVPLLAARAVPNGVVEEQWYQRVKARLLQLAREAAPAEGVVLALHGSMRTEVTGDAEGDLLTSLRQLLPDIPVTAALDMHATVTDSMIQHLDGMVGYKTAPHADCYETGKQAAWMMIHMLEGGAPLQSAWCRLPILIAGEKSETSTYPMNQLTALTKELEEKPGILAASLFLGFPWADAPEAGVTVLVTAEAGTDIESPVHMLSSRFWELRCSFTFHTDAYAPAEALQEAFRSVRAGTVPVYISDSGDNPTAGAAGDCTELLDLLFRQETLSSLKMPVLYTGFYDPPAVRTCLEHIDEPIALPIGARFDAETSQPVICTGRVVRYVRGWGKEGADLVLFRSGNTEIVISSKHIGFASDDIWHALGVEPEQRELVILKLGYLPAVHKAKARRSIMALTAGASNERLEMLAYHQVPRPIFPLDQEVTVALSVQKKHAASGG